MKQFDATTKPEIIQRIVAEVELNGSSRVGYHVEQVLGTDRPIKYHIKSKIEASMVCSRKYISRPHPNFKNDFEILVNPNYIEEKENLELQQLRTNNILLVEQLSDINKIRNERNIAILLGVISIILNVILIYVESSKK